MNLAYRKPQDNFEVPEERKAIIRSDRLEFIGIHSELEFHFGSFEVSNYSATGIAIIVKTGADLFTKPETYTAFHTVDGVKVGTYDLCVARKAPFPSREATQVAFELKTGSVPIHKINTVIKLRKVLNGFNKTQQDLSKIPAEFRRLVLEGKLFLQSLEAQVEELRAEKKFCPLQELHNFENTLIPIVAEFITDWSTTTHLQLEASLKDVARRRYSRYV